MLSLSLPQPQTRRVCDYPSRGQFGCWWRTKKPTSNGYSLPWAYSDWLQGEFITVMVPRCLSVSNIRHTDSGFLGSVTGKSLSNRFICKYDFSVIVRMKCPSVYRLKCKASLSCWPAISTILIKKESQLWLLKLALKS